MIGQDFSDDASLLFFLDSDSTFLEKVLLPTPLVVLVYYKTKRPQNKNEVARLLKKTAAATTIDKRKAIEILWLGG